jgi:signal-transduction protein with cAMP-binding, CBS, and nucleotidyltransferase domain
MKFVKVNRVVLNALRAMGYNVLISPVDVQDPQNITWKAMWVEDVDTWIRNLYCEQVCTARPNILDIDYVLTNVPECYLSGSVFIESDKV